MRDKIVLITGSTDGVGRKVAIELGRLGARILVHGRDTARARDVVAEITRAGGAAEFYPADLASLADVRSLAAVIAQDHDRLDVLVNNAGVGTRTGGPHRRTSADGHELRFAVNYLAGYLLTRSLLPLLRASPQARIVNVASAGQAPIDFDDVMLARRYDGTHAYMQSKLAQVMFTIDLAQELAGSGITVNCLHPATYMATTMVREAGVSPVSTVEEGADAIINLVVSPALEGRSGLYFNRHQETRAHAQAYDEAARRRLHELSRRLAGMA